MLRLRGELGISRWHRFLPSSRSSVDDEELRVDAQLVQETAAETAICSPADTQIACFQKNLDWRMELAPFTEILYFECLTVQPLFSTRDWETKSVMYSICYTLWAATKQLIWCNDVIHDRRLPRRHTKTVSVSLQQSLQRHHCSPRLFPVVLRSMFHCAVSDRPSVSWRSPWYKPGLCYTTSAFLIQHSNTAQQRNQDTSVSNSIASSSGAPIQLAKSFIS